jgi:hypothetical protein
MFLLDVGIPLMTNYKVHETKIYYVKYGELKYNLD